MTNASFVAQTAEWVPAHLYATLQAAYQHKGFSFVRILQRCPVFTPTIFQKAVKDPATRRGAGPRRRVVAPDLDRSSRTGSQHDPRDLDGGAPPRRAAPSSSIWASSSGNPDAPRYEETRRVPPHTATERMRVLDAELDRYAV